MTHSVQADDLHYSESTLQINQFYKVVRLATDHGFIRVAPRSASPFGSPLRELGTVIAEAEESIRCVRKSDQIGTLRTLLVAHHSLGKYIAATQSADTDSLAACYACISVEDLIYEVLQGFPIYNFKSDEIERARTVFSEHAIQRRL
jgi:hypothetical protein